MARQANDARKSIKQITGELVIPPEAVIRQPPCQNRQQLIYQSTIWHANKAKTRKTIHPFRGGLRAEDSYIVDSSSANYTPQ